MNDYKDRFVNLDFLILKDKNGEEIHFLRFIYKDGDCIVEIYDSREKMYNAKNN